MKKLILSIPYRGVIKFIHFILLIPLIVFITVDKLILLFAPIVFRPDILFGESGFKIFMWVWMFFIPFTFIYYFFISIFKALNKFRFRLYFSVIFLFLFTIILYDFSYYDYRVDLGVMAYFMLYYVYFFISLRVIKTDISKVLVSLKDTFKIIFLPIIRLQNHYNPRL